MSSEKRNKLSLLPLRFRLKQHVTRGLWPPLTPVSLPIPGSHIAPADQETLWERGMAWLRYTAIQWRWDIERAVARILHRRWGTGN